MRRLLWWVPILLLGIAAAAAGQQPEAGRKQARAVRVAPGAIAVDGRLDEDVWKTAPLITDFVQKEPTEGASPSDSIQIAFAYDDTALYVGARMASEHVPLQSHLARRDDDGQVEFIVVALDTYLDHRTAYGFGVTAAGVRLDRFYPADADSFDSQTDPVWEARTRVEQGGWTAEMWIPLSQLRFNVRDQQIWGLNVFRFVPANNESDYWIAVPRTVTAWASRFGELRGIDGLKPPHRLELLPYLAGSSTITGNRDPRNPFDDGKNLVGRAGADIKVGFGSNLTLDAAVNPDFGQVEADPAEVNLSAFETFFDEKRPFFIEGNGLLSSRFDTFFYSRRIGAAPTGPASGDFVDYPRTSTILGAAKLTGRLQSKTSIGILGAETQAETATTFDLSSTSRTRVPVAPATAYGVGRIQQEFGPNASTAAIMMTVVHRDMRSGDPLASLLTRNAFTMNGDSLLRFKGGLYELSGQAGVTHIDGDAPAIARVQQNSAHYFQRPDKSYSPLNPLLTSMNGGYGALRFARTGGTHWVWNAGVYTESPEYELNDIGRLQSADGITRDLNLTYRETQPNSWLRNYSISLSRFNEWNYAGDPQNNQWSPQINVTWLNFWTTKVQAWLFQKILDERLTRGGPLMVVPQAAQEQLEIASPTARQTQGKFGTYYSNREDGNRLRYFYGGMSVRPSPRWQLSVSPTVSHEVDTKQYLATLDGGPVATYGKHYVFGRVERATYSAQFRLNYTLRPDLTIDLYAEPFAASGRYSDFRELAAPRTELLTPYPFTENRDFNTRSFRSNAVLRWEWRPGSTLYVVWQQNRASTQPVGTASVGDMFSSLSAPGDHVFAVKTTFWVAP